MAEGRTKASYNSDILGVKFNIDSPNNLYAQTAVLGVTAGSGTQTRMPKRLRARHAVGVNAGGKRVKVIVFDITGTLWTRAVATWSYIDNFGATQTATVTGLVGEAVTV
jgi:hypothetical protein